MKNGFALALFILLLAAGIAAAEDDLPNVWAIDVALPEGYAVYNGTWLEEKTDEALLVIGSEREDAVKLAEAARGDGESYRVTACSESILPFANSPLDEVWIQGDACTGNNEPFFWYGVGGTKTEREVYLSMEEDESGALFMSSGYVKDRANALDYQFFVSGPGLLSVSGECIYPMIEWKTGVSMQLDGFDLAKLDDVCSAALACTDSRSGMHGILDRSQAFIEQGTEDEPFVRLIWIPDDEETD